MRELLGPWLAATPPHLASKTASLYQATLRLTSLRPSCGGSLCPAAVWLSLPGQSPRKAAGLRRSPAASAKAALAAAAGRRLTCLRAIALWRAKACGERLDVASVAPVLFAPFSGGVSEAPGTIAAKSLLLTPFPASTCERKSGVLARRLDRWANLCIVELGREEVGSGSEPSPSWGMRRCRRAPCAAPHPKGGGWLGGLCRALARRPRLRATCGSGRPGEESMRFKHLVRHGRNREYFRANRESGNRRRGRVSRWRGRPATAAGPRPARWRS